jgi:hypothetical protein
VRALVVDALGDAAVGLLLRLTSLATVVADGGEGGSQVVDLVRPARSPALPAAVHAGGPGGPSICQPSSTRPGRKVQPSTAP